MAMTSPIIAEITPRMSIQVAIAEGQNGVLMGAYIAAASSWVVACDGKIIRERVIHWVYSMVICGFLLQDDA
jgi:hypothetical protein